jgi:hypothetical protein
MGRSGCPGIYTKQVAAEDTLPDVHDSTGDHSKSMAGMIGTDSINLQPIPKSNQ